MSEMAAANESGDPKVPATPMSAMCTDFLPRNPFRPPDWRWQRAGQLAGPGARPRRLDDDRVRRARSFRAALGKAGGDLRDRRLARSHEDVHGAYRIHHGEPRRRGEIEARLLAGQSDEEIAGRVGVEPQVVEAYESLFFNVRDRLESSDWIAFSVFGERLYGGFDAGDIDLAWKILAYHGGPVVLDALIEHDQRKGRPGSGPGEAEPIDLLIWLMATPVTAENAADFLRLDAQLRALDRAEAARGIAPATGPVVIPPVDVSIGPKTIPLMDAGDSPVEADGGGSAGEAGAIGPSGVV
jgi:hypothetical protein